MSPRWWSVPARRDTPPRPILPPSGGFANAGRHSIGGGRAARGAVIQTSAQCPRRTTPWALQPQVRAGLCSLGEVATVSPLNLSRRLEKNQAKGPRLSPPPGRVMSNSARTNSSPYGDSMLSSRRQCGAWPNRQGTRSAAVIATSRLLAIHVRVRIPTTPSVRCPD